MYCESCGSFIPDGQSFCSNCGAPAPQPANQTSSAPSAQPVVVQPVQPVQQPVVQPIQVQPVPVQPVYQQPVQPVYAQPVYSQPVTTASPTPAKRGNGAATAGLVFGILTMVFSWIPFFNIFTTAILGLLGLIFSIVGIAKKNARGKGKGIAGLILTILGTVITVVFYVYVFSAVSESSDFRDLLDEVSTMDYDDLYSTSYSFGEKDNSFFIDGDFVKTDKGYVSGVLHIDGYRVDF